MNPDLLILGVWTVGLLLTVPVARLFSGRDPVHRRAARVARQSAQRRAARRRRNARRSA